MIKVTCRVESYDDSAKPSILVHSHWNNDNMVVLEIDGTNITVKGSDLQSAIQNCTNINRFA